MTTCKITPVFKLVFFTVLGLTLLSGATSLCLATQSSLSAQQNRIFESCSTTWQMGVGAIFGLLGSKATDLLQEEEQDDL
jgi:hypothetical protein